jgi:pyrroline-5-carboxylate reductase
MAEALIRGIITANVCRPEAIFVSDIRPERLRLLAREYNVIAVDSNAELAAEAQTIVLSVKPQNMTDALESIKAAVAPDKLVISIAAGIKLAKIAGVLGPVPIVRVMPNMPAVIGQGATALYANEKAKPMLDAAITIFSSVGKAVLVDNEDLIDAVTAVSGSGPAYFFLLMEEMIKAGVELGLPEDTAKNLVLQTAKGAGLLAAEADKKGQSPAALRKNVTSPGGTTEAALKVMAASNFGRLINNALAAACKRSKELCG